MDNPNLSMHNAVTQNALQDFPNHRCWAVIGVSTDRSKYGNKIFRDLLEAGYKVYAINPKLEVVEGQACYPSIQDLPEVPDVVNVVVPPQAAEKVVLDCIEAGVKRIWFQPGSESDVAIHEAEAAGITVVSNACIMIQKKQWA